LDALLSHGEKLKEKAKVSKAERHSLRSFKSAKTVRDSKSSNAKNVQIRKEKGVLGVIKHLWKIVTPETGGKYLLGTITYAKRLLLYS
jgi:hypothetical protein